MIDARLAQEYVTNLYALHDLKTQIVDRNGFIVASCDASQVGEFHEAAYQMIRQASLAASQHSVDAGDGAVTVSTLLMENRAPAGLLQMTGEEKTVRIFVSAVKLSLETMMEHEQISGKLQKYDNKRDLFLQKLLYDPQVSLSELESRASSLGYAYDCLRVPVFGEYRRAAPAPIVAPTIKVRLLPMIFLPHICYSAPSLYDTRLQIERLSFVK